MAQAAIRAPKPKPSMTTIVASEETAGIVFTATVEPQGTGGPNPTGTITFADGQTVIATVVVDGAIENTLTSPSSVTATYNGDAKYQPSTSQTLTPPYT